MFAAGAENDALRNAELKLLRGIRYLPNGAVTDSIVMRSRSGTVRRVEATHLLDKLEQLTGRQYR